MVVDPVVLARQTAEAEQAGQAEPELRIGRGVGDAGIGAQRLDLAIGPPDAGDGDGVAVGGALRREVDLRPAAVLLDIVVIALDLEPPAVEAVQIDVRRLGEGQ